MAEYGYIEKSRPQTARCKAIVLKMSDKSWNASGRARSEILAPLITRG